MLIQTERTVMIIDICICIINNEQQLVKKYKLMHFSMQKL